MGKVPSTPIVTLAEPSKLAAELELSFVFKLRGVVSFATVPLALPVPPLVVGKIPVTPALILGVPLKLLQGR